MAPNTSRGPVGGAAATDAPAAVVRLVVADAHRLMQDAVAAQLEPERFEIVGRARTGSEALALVACSPWNQRCLLHAASGLPVWGDDYYSNLVIWALPMALAGQDVGQFVSDGGLVRRMLA